MIRMRMTKSMAPMKAFLVLAWIGFSFALLLLATVSVNVRARFGVTLPPSGNDEPTIRRRRRQRQRRRLTFFDPKSVEFKDGSLKPKNSTWTTQKKTTTQKKPTPLFQEGRYKSSSTIQTSASASTSAGTQPNGERVKTQIKVAPDNAVASSQSQSDTEPSYIRLCRELIHRTTDQGVNNNNNNNDIPNDPFVVYESPDVCNSHDSFTALTYIMLSAAISQAGSNARLVYHHNCTTPPSMSMSMSTSTIQQWLPRDLTYAVGIGQRQMQQKCSTCLSSHHFTECMGMPIAGVMSEPLDPMTTSFRIAGFRHNIQQAVQDMKKADMGHEMESPPSYGGAVIVLDLDQETSGRSWALPLYVYEDIIPANVSSIAILTTQRCMDTVPTCQHHGDTLAEVFTKRYPSTKVYTEVLPSTSMAYARIMDAPQLICPSTIFCILPSLYHEYSKASYHVMNSNLYEWFKYVARENRKLMGKQLVILEQDTIKTKPLTESADDLDQFLHRQRPTP